MVLHRVGAIYRDGFGIIALTNMALRPCPLVAAFCRRIKNTSRTAFPRNGPIDLKGVGIICLSRPFKGKQENEGNTGSGGYESSLL